MRPLRLPSTSEAVELRDSNETLPSAEISDRNEATCNVGDRDCNRRGTRETNERTKQEASEQLSA